MYMCRETIRRSVVQKFNDTKGWNCKNLDDLYDKIEDRQEANDIINNIKICDPAVGSGHFLVSALNEMIAIKNDLKILQDRKGRRLKEYMLEVVNDELVITDDDDELFEYRINNKESLRLQEALFHEKQTIIENCLFGVDINPNSVKICRLRLWIELLKNAYYKNATALETLPNIDINIKCGNSLISRFDLKSNITELLKKSKWGVATYRSAVDAYRNAKSKEEKHEMERLIEDIKSDFRSEVSKNDPKIKRLSRLRGEHGRLTTQTRFFEISNKEKTAWNRKVQKLTKDIKKLKTEIEDIKNNKIYEKAFEWRFEFPEVLNDDGDFVGFDAIIGNPPYMDYRDINNLFIQSLIKFQTFDNSRRPNLYHFFIEQAYYIMRLGGHFCFINPNQMLSIDAGYGIRKFLVENTVLQFIDDLSYVKVFDDAATYTMIWSFRKERNGNYPIKISKCKTIEDIGKTTITIQKNDIIANGRYLIIANVNQILISKIEKGNVKLGELCKMKWGTSQSGYGKKKIKVEEYEALSAEDKQKYRPIIQTRDIKKWVIDWKKEYIPTDIFSNSIKSIVTLPHKIVIARMTLKLQAALDENQFFVGKSTIVFDIKNLNPIFLLALLNSRLINFWYVNYFENTHLSGGYIRFDIPYLKKIPIAMPTPKGQDEIVAAVQRIQKVKATDPKAGTSDLEDQIDRLVYRLYGLSEEEVGIVEGVME